MKNFTFDLVGKATRKVVVKAKNEKDAIKLLDKLIRKTPIADFSCQEINELEVCLIDETATIEPDKICSDCPIYCSED